MITRIICNCLVGVMLLNLLGIMLLAAPVIWLAASVLRQDETTP